MLILEITAGVLIVFFALPYWRHILILGGAGTLVSGTVYAAEFGVPPFNGTPLDGAPLDAVLLAIAAAVVGIAIWVYRSLPAPDNAPAK
jgi:hypothetical protein